MSLSELLKTLNDHGKLSDVAPEPSLQIGAVPPTQEQMAPHSLPQDRQEIPPLQPAPVQVSRQAVQEREVDAEWRNDLIQFFPPNRAAEEERVPAVQPSVHLSVGEVEELKHRVHSLEKENNELKRQLSRMSQHYRTPPPNEQAAPVLMMRTPGSDRVGTPTTPAAMAALSATAPSFIPITSPNGFVTSNISPVYNNMTPSPQGTPTAIMGLSPTQGTPTSSPGPKCVVTNNVCRHWVCWIDSYWLNVTKLFLDVNHEIDVGLHNWGSTPRDFVFQVNFFFAICSLNRFLAYKRRQIAGEKIFKST